MPETHLFLITIQRYRHHPSVRGAVADAERFREVLVSRYGYSTACTPELRNEHATNAALRQAFRDLKEIPQNDDLIIYFNGHGYTDEDKVGFWLPYDAGDDLESGTNVIQNHRLRNYLRSVKCRHVLLLANCCFSGDLLSEYRNLTVKRSQDYLHNARLYASREVLTAGGSELVPAAGMGDESPFGWHLCTTLEQSDATWLDAMDLFSHLKRGIVDQMPQYGRLQKCGDKKGALILEPGQSKAIAAGDSPAGSQHVESSGVQADFFLVKDRDRDDLQIPIEALAEGGEDAVRRQQAFAEERELPVEVLMPMLAMAFRLVPSGDSVSAEETSYPFYFSTTPVTNGMWESVMGGLPESAWPKDDHPVVDVSWFQAKRFCKAVCRAVGREGAIRLPWEREWERACRAATSGRFAFCPPLSEEKVCYGLRRNGEPLLCTEMLPNAWGIRGCHGNVGEWCLDDFGSAASAARVAKVVRGGSYHCSLADCEAGARLGARAADRGCEIGFRLVLSLDAVRDAF